MPEVRNPHTPAVPPHCLVGVCAAAAVLFGVLCVPRPALAQSDKWQVDVAPPLFVGVGDKWQPLRA